MLQRRLLITKLVFVFVYIKTMYVAKAIIVGSDTSYNLSVRNRIMVWFNLKPEDFNRDLQVKI